ncbi:MAG: DUF2752 domain-containing protein [Raineya sp.]|nr:DUF2752 domain-containing protein [Raineya sp.]MDW8297473.1 DUF2752 domain-containing protein [Raineya sp.]
MKKTLLNLWFLALFLTPFVLWLLPSDTFDEGMSICPSKVFFDIECLGCGITRAVMHFHHFEFAEAFYYNLGVVWVYPFLIFLWVTWIKVAYKYSTWARYILEILKKRFQPTT